jgi:hypothetical protein
MAEFVYLLCAAMSVLCAFLLMRGYRKTRTKLLLWSSISFTLLAINNLILCVDLLVLPNVDFHGIFLRSALVAAAGCTLIFGLIWELI